MEVELPSVSGAFGDTPEITYPSSQAPKGLKVVMLEEGNGAVVHAGDEVEVNYHGQIWDGELFDSSYFRGEPTRFPIGVGMVIKGWDQALVGKQIGSRVLIIVPPDKGYGPSGNPRAGIKGDDVLVFVVDILGVNQTAFSTHSIR
ncbi:FKBP-type peptidyl-prolyl cis-trans isomerase [Arcanobacterium pinnipediorum]|uniref:Peptidyl-prolyl cis-trans isomerase n=1 Tax=Arcanobacterium pinnipediorum TaxID=1503041 RepID=A0ABY5AH66_9ACTO|nr:FKBP-type peptidyl-prolyl cis-trans isomerase [Arcanobacterium pinnipediorum]USR79197.1 FKBP-type peptidyl-prolyl cis-trans isomerase [Arcanobacterium pinnipediorum]